MLRKCPARRSEMVPDLIYRVINKKMPLNKTLRNYRQTMKIKQLIITQSAVSIEKRKAKIKFKQWLSGLSNNIKKLDQSIVSNGSKMIDAAPEKAGNVFKESGGMIKNLFGNSKLGNKIGTFIEDGGNQLLNNKEAISSKVKGGITKVRDIMIETANKGGNITVTLAEKIKGKKLTEIEKKRYHKFGEIATHISIPGSVTALGTFLFFIDADVDVDGLEEISLHDPEVLEALARSCNTITKNSSFPEIQTYLSGLDSEASMDGFVNNIKGILGELELLDELNNGNEGIQYFMPDATNNPDNDIFGKDINGNIVEKIQVKVTSDPNYVKAALQKLPEDTMVFVNSEVGNELKGIKNIISTSLSEKELEDRVINFLSKLRRY